MRERFREFRVVVVGLSLVALLASPVSAPAAEPLREVHWKSEMTVEALGMTIPSETWIRGDKVRVVAQTPVGESVTVITGGVAYVRTPMMAMKTNVSDSKGPGAGSGADVARDLEAILAQGTKVGTETVDGEVCETWKTSRTEGGTSVDMMLWISPSLRFPRRIRLQTEMGEALIRNREIEKKVTLDDAAFRPDTNVVYREMSDVLRQLQREAGRTPAPQTPR